MPYPSRGCRTCRLRHVKCDEAYPLCNRCITAGKECLGFITPPTEFAFKDENSYASGIPRRPRNIDDAKSSSTSGSSFSSALRDKQLQVVIMHPSRSILLSQDLPLEAYAFANFARKYLDVRDNVPDSHWAHITRYRHEWESSDKHSILGVAVTALSLAIFGRTRASATALDISVRKYNEAVIRTQGLLDDSIQVLHDKTLLTVMLLDSYEHIVCDLEKDCLLSQGFRHQDGAKVLLKLRRDHGSSNKSALLDRDVRQQLLRTSMLRGISVPEWFRDSLDVGVSGSDIELDLALMDAAQLRCDVQAFYRRDPGFSPTHTHANEAEAQIILDKALAVDSALLAWSESLSLDWMYASHQVGPETRWSPRVGHNSSFYNGSMHIYQDVEQAVAWNRYRGGRIFATHIMARMLNFQSIRSSDPTISAKRSAAVSTVQSLVNDICASVPFIFDERNDQSLLSTVQGSGEGDGQLSARRAFLLSFPLCIAAGMAIIPAHQQQWIHSQLLLISQVTGSRTLEIVGTQGAIRIWNASLTQSIR